MGGFGTALRNSIFKPAYRLLHWHGLPLHEERMDKNKAALEAVTLDELYKDKKVVSKEFVQGGVTQQGDDKDEL